MDSPGTVVPAAGPGPAPAVNQMYKECLVIAFRREYYQELYNRTIKYSKVFDYSIGLGSAASGGTGLGILADPRFGWVCALMTTVSVFLSVAKGVWDWSGKSKFALDRAHFYGKLYADYKALVDDVDAARQWSQSFAERRNALRSASTPEAPDPYPELSEKVKRKVQERVKTRIDYRRWWLWT
jgi:hypothetical protein